MLRSTRSVPACFSVQEGRRRRRLSFSCSSVLDRFFSWPTSAPEAPQTDVKPGPAVVDNRDSGSPWAGFPALLSRRQSPRPTLPVYVMLPLDAVTRDGVVTNSKALAVGFQARALWVPNRWKSQP
jgi:hypothetical protein